MAAKFGGTCERGQASLDESGRLTGSSRRDKREGRAGGVKAFHGEALGTANLDGPPARAMQDA